LDYTHCFGDEAPTYVLTVCAVGWILHVWATQHISQCCSFRSLLALAGSTLACLTVPVSVWCLQLCISVIVNFIMLIYWLLYETMQDESAELCFIFHNAHSVLYFSLEK